nr:hypothetical protein [Lentimicrobiaceae bacterium]
SNRVKNPAENPGTRANVVSQTHRALLNVLLNNLLQNLTVKLGTIGNHCKLDNHVQVGHDTVIGERCLISSHVAIAGVTRLEDDVILWGQVAVQKDLVIGKGAVVLAKSGVDKTLEGGKVYFGVPARESRTVWREMVLMKQLPEIVEKLKQL